jgi:fluoroacetyl-CoA thioesterase
MEIAKGLTHCVDTPVTLSMTASAFATRPGENYPAVLGTPFLISELERVSADMLVPLLGEGQVSVGVSVNIEHLAPTPVGSTIRSHARFLGQEGKLYWFEVWTEDPAGLVGRGKHARAIVDLSAIETRAASRSSATI